MPSRQCGPPGTVVTSERQPKRLGRAQVWIRVDAKRAANRSGSRAHARQAVPVAAGCRIEAVSVVVYSQHEPTVVDGQVRFHRRASGMLDGVVDALLEDQIRLAPLVGVHDDALIGTGSAKVELDVLRIGQVGAESPDSLNEVAQAVLSGIDRPDDVAHRVDKLARRGRDLLDEVRHDRIVHLGAGTRDLAEDRDLCQARANVVVKVRRDASPDSLDFDQARDAGPMKPEDAGAQQQSENGEEPDSLPVGRCRCFAGRVEHETGLDSTADRRSDGEHHEHDARADQRPEQRRFPLPHTAIGRGRSVVHHPTCGCLPDA